MMHAHENIPQSFWAEMINSAAYILNQTGPSSIEGMSPYELWYGKKPGLKHLRVIGSKCYVHVPKQLRVKMDRKAVKGILIGYDHDDGYRIWCEEKHQLMRSRDVTFEEKIIQNETPVVPVDLDCSQQKSQESLQESENKMESSFPRENDFCSNDDLHNEIEDVLEQSDMELIRTQLCDCSTLNVLKGFKTMQCS